MTQDLFDIWNKKKKFTHNRKDSPAFRIREIWWTQLGKNISSETIGKGTDFLRPVLILQKFYGSSALVIPLTSQDKNGHYYFKFQDSKNIKQIAILPQIRYIDGKRLKRKLSKVNPDTFSIIQKKLFMLIENNPQPEGGGS